MGWNMAGWRLGEDGVDENALTQKGAESGERMTDGKGRGRWERRENKSRGGRCGGDQPKNVREPERVVGWLRCRVDSNFLPHDLDSTAPYLNPVIPTLLFISLYLLYSPHYLDVTPLHYVSSLPSPFPRLMHSS